MGGHLRIPFFACAFSVPVRLLPIIGQFPKDPHKKIFPEDRKQTLQSAVSPSTLPLIRQQISTSTSNIALHARPGPKSPIVIFPSIFNMSLYAPFTGNFSTSISNIFLYAQFGSKGKKKNPLSMSNISPYRALSQGASAGADRQLRGEGVRGRTRTASGAH